jgi:alpha-beta hydrolase superfamily lysophospholipase
MTQSNNLDINHLSIDQAVVDAYRNDPLVHDRISVELGLSMLQSARWLDEFRGRVRKPLLLMHGRADQLTDPLASEQLAERTDGPVTLRIWDNLRHELHNEPRSGDVADFLLAWLAGVTAGS